MTTAQQLAAVSAAPNVIAAFLAKDPEPIPKTTQLHHARMSWYYLSGGFVLNGGADLIIVNYGVAGQESAYWFNTLPSILAERTAPTFITGRNTPFTGAQVETFCNAQWRATQGNSAALAVKEFTVSNVDPNTIRVGGLFHDVATNQRQRLSYLITLVDANGSTSGANVKFEKVVE